MRNTTKITIASAGLLAVVAGGGAVAFAGTATPTPAPSVTATSPAPVNTTPGAETAPTTPQPGEAEAKIKRDAAVKIAQDKVPGAKLVKAEFDGGETPTTWEVELLQGDVEHEFEIDATSGAVLEQGQETSTAAERAADQAEDQAEQAEDQAEQAGGQDDDLNEQNDQDDD
ncbi:PepSY domain-containing protein [Streptosporangium sp. NPDC023615]|uniref:PepSY domain-containing protein n=1 Tax=Streptosporangium sp. NPDC023615 TaxID=3154794 RepID=UPI00344995A9